MLPPSLTVALVVLPETVMLIFFVPSVKLTEFGSGAVPTAAPSDVRMTLLFERTAYSVPSIV